MRFLLGVLSVIARAVEELLLNFYSRAIAGVLSKLPSFKAYSEITWWFLNKLIRRRHLFHSLIPNFQS